MGVAAVWAVGLGFLSSGCWAADEMLAVLRRTLAGLDCGGAELAAGLRDAGAAGDAVDGVVVVPTGPLLLLGLDAVVMRQSPPV